MTIAWTEELEKKLIYWWDKGYSRSEIAEKMNLNKKAVSSKIYRMKLEKKGRSGIIKAGILDVAKLGRDT